MVPVLEKKTRPDCSPRVSDRTVRSFYRSPFELETGLFFSQTGQYFSVWTAVPIGRTVRSGLFQRSTNKATVRTGPDRGQSTTNRVINSTIWGTKAVLIAGELTERELDILTQRVQAQLNARSSESNRAVLQKGGHLTSDKAKAVKAKKQKEHIAKEGNRKTKTYSATWNRVYKVYREAGVAARKTERKRINILKTGNIDPELLIPIPDPEKEVTVAQINLQVREELIGNPLFSEGQFEPYEEALAEKRAQKQAQKLGRKEDGDGDVQLPFTSQQDYIAFGPEIGYESDALLSDGECDIQSSRLLN